MKNFLKKLVQKALAVLARAIIKKYQPQIIGITGSVGKTSTKQAIFKVLALKFNVRQNIKNYNNEIGLPLTIIGAGSGGRSVWGWLGVFMRALVLLAWRDKNYPKILVLEMAVDRVGDMKYLTDLAPCQIGVVTNISPVHLEFFKTLERIAKEKSVMVSHLDKNGWAVLNCDNHYVCDMEQVVKGRVIKYGITSEQAQVRASEIIISKDSGERVAGLSFKLSYQGSTVPVLLPNILGEHLVYAALAAAAVGVINGMNLLEISEALRLFEAPKGRMRLLAGIKNTFIIDDSYNAGPESMAAALSVLGQLNVLGKKIAVLGDMLELGEYTVEAHQNIGALAAANKIDSLITVGERARLIGEKAKELGLRSEDIFNFSDAETAGCFIQDRIETGDFILVKGSQGMRMEKIVKEIMAEPLKAKDLLVRQDKPWS